MQQVSGRGKVRNFGGQIALGACTYGEPGHLVGLRYSFDILKLPDVGVTVRGRLSWWGEEGTVDEGGVLHCAVLQRTRDRAVQATQTSEPRALCRAVRRLRHGPRQSPAAAAQGRTARWPKMRFCCWWACGALKPRLGAARSACRFAARMNPEDATDTDHGHLR